MSNSNQDALEFIKKLRENLDETWSIANVKDEIELFLTEELENQEQDREFTSPFKLGLLDSNTKQKYDNPFERDSED